MFEAFVQAMLPIVEQSGVELVGTAVRTLVSSFAADLAVFAERVDETGALSPLAAFAFGERVEARLGRPDDVTDLGARALALVGTSPDASPDVSWHAKIVGVDAVLGIVVRGPLVDPLRSALDLVAARCAAEVMRTRAAERHLIVSNAIGEVVWEWIVGSDQLAWSENARALFGIDHDGSTSTTRDEWLARIDPTDRLRVEDSLKELVEGRRADWLIDYRFSRADGTTALVRERGVALRSKEGAHRLVGRMTDITQTKALEQRLVLAERMASMGTLAAGVAHEINNPLAYVKGNVEHVLHELRGVADLDPDLITALEDAREGAERVRRIVNDLLSFSRPHDTPPVPVDVERVIESALAIANNAIHQRARLETVFRHPPPVDANEARFGQLILNLVVNALQALPDGAADANVLRIETGVDDGGKVFVVVADTGAGIAGDVIGRIFDPFFSTKPVGEGTGLGLSIAHAIVTSLGGDISVESAPGSGTTFRLTLPPSAPVKPLA